MAYIPGQEVISVVPIKGPPTRKLFYLDFVYVKTVKEKTIHDLAKEIKCKIRKLRVKWTREMTGDLELGKF